jgi:hypothetical protein
MGRNERGWLKQKGCESNTGETWEGDKGTKRMREEKKQMMLSISHRHDQAG